MAKNKKTKEPSKAKMHTVFEKAVRALRSRITKDRSVKIGRVLQYDEVNGQWPVQVLHDDTQIGILYFYADGQFRQSDMWEKVAFAK